MIKDDRFRDNPPNPGFRPCSPSNDRLLPVYNSNRPEVHRIVAEMRSVIDEFSDRVLIGEIYLPVSQLMTYYGNDLNGANLPFNFHLLQCPWSAAAVAGVMGEYDRALPAGAWPNWVLGNHDQPRLASRIGTQQARVAALLLFSLPGTLTMYYGEELGMINTPIAPDQVQDPAEKNEPGIGQGRDPERTPMCWDGTALAGFTTGRPWLPLGAEHATVNVAAEREDSDSMLQLYRRLIALRKAHPTLVSGALRDIRAEQGVLRYRRSGAEEIEVVLNLTHEAVAALMPQGMVLAGTHRDRDGQTLRGSLTLRAAEGFLLRVG
jgi:alpha-glucosidase